MSHYVSSYQKWFLTICSLLMGRKGNGGGGRRRSGCWMVTLLVAGVSEVLICVVQIPGVRRR